MKATLPKQESPRMTPGQIKRRFNISYSTLSDWRKRGIIQAFGVKSPTSGYTTYRYRASDVEAISALLPALNPGGCGVCRSYKRDSDGVLARSGVSRVDGFSFRSNQLSLGLIVHDVEGALIQQRAFDGYINATAMCNACGKRYFDYSRLRTTEAFLSELSSVTGIPVTGLSTTIQGGTPSEQGTYVHPQVAINLGQWCPPKFAVAVSQWVYDWSTGKIVTASLPYHLRRYMANRSKIPHTHWSMLNELTYCLVAPMETYARHFGGKNVLKVVSRSRPRH